MRILWTLAAKELRDGLRNRWVASAIGLLGALALSLAFLGSAPTGAVKVDALAVSVASLSSLTVYLLPLIALMLSFDALVGEVERGTLLLLLTYPVARWQVVIGKFAGHAAILGAAVLVGFGGAGLAIGLVGGADPESIRAYLAMMGSSLLLGTAFLALGYLVSILVRERSTAAGAAVALWLLLVVLYDLALLGVLLADQGQRLGPDALAALLLLNPTDAYRLLNLAGTQAVGLVSGLAGTRTLPGLDTPVLLGAIAAWVALPLGLTVALFQRREL